MVALWLNIKISCAIIARRIRNCLLKRTIALRFLGPRTRSVEHAGVDETRRNAIIARARILIPTSPTVSPTNSLV